MVQVSRLTDMQYVLKLNYNEFLKDYKANKNTSDIFFKVYKENKAEVPVYVDYESNIIEFDRWV